MVKRCPRTSIPEMLAPRHPWLADLVLAPEAEIRALVGGYADIGPFGRDEPADAAVSLLFGLAADDPARMAFDTGCLALLDRLRDAIPAAGDDRYERFVARLDRLLAVIRRTEPERTVRALHTQYARWYRAVETLAVDRNLDPRREFWRLLALTQDAAPQPRQYLPLWLDICAEAGPNGRYNDTYLDIGLLGLRRLPLTADDDSNEEAACHGIARWAARQLPSRPVFEARWNEIEAAYPRAPDYWPDLVQDTIAAHPESFPAAVWWRELADLPGLRQGEKQKPSARQRAVQPPSPLGRLQILTDANLPLQALAPRIDVLMQAHRRYADHTGDTHYIVHTACDIGMRLIKKPPPAERIARGTGAAALGRNALRYAPHNPFAWALWRDGLAAAGSFAAAETIGWESVRRYPENEQWRNQLAKLIGERLGRFGEAERLLRETIAQFPGNAVARTQLATVLADGLNQPEQAVSVLREVIALAPDDPYSYGQLAHLLADRLGDRPGAEAVLRDEVRRMPDDKLGHELMARLQAGERVRRGRPPARPSASSAEQPVVLDFDTAAPLARRALFRFETAADATAVREIGTLLAADKGHPYLRYAAQRVGAAGLARPDTAFAFAFDRAARAGSAEAFRALTAQFTDGVERWIAQAGLSLISGGLPAPPPCNDDPMTPLSRFGRLTEGFKLYAPETDRRPALRLVADFAASGLAQAA